MHPVAAVRAMRKLLDNPHDTSQVFVIIDALSGKTLIRLTRRFMKHPMGARILAEERQLVETLSDRPRLHQMPEGSLGKLYAEFCDREGITADGLVEASQRDEEEAVEIDERFRLVGNRLRDMHDLWHVVTGYETDLIGEASLLAFSIPQTRNPGVAFIVFTVFLQARGETSFVRMLMLKALLRGLKAEWFVPQDWEGMLELPLSEVRDQLRVGLPPSYEQVRAPSPSEAPARGKRGLFDAAVAAA